MIRLPVMQFSTTVAKERCLASLSSDDFCPSSALYRQMSSLHLPGRENMPDKEMTNYGDMKDSFKEAEKKSSSHHRFQRVHKVRIPYHQCKRLERGF